MNKRVYEPQGEMPPPLNELTPESRTPILTTLSTVTPRPIEWLWPGRFALGKVSLIPGDPGCGKSHITLDIAARISRGMPWPDGTGLAVQGDVIILSAEDNVADTIHPRLEAAGADLERIHMLEGIELASGKSGNTIPMAVTIDDLPIIETTLRQTPRTRLFIVDPISAFLGSGVDSHKNAEVRALLAPLAELTARYGVAMICVTHLNKGSSKALYRATGSLAFVAAARAVWIVARDNDDPSRRLFLPMKNNLAPDSTGLAYTLEPWASNTSYARVEWEPDRITTSVDEVMDSYHNSSRQEWKRARDWLLELLKDGRMDPKSIFSLGDKEKFSEKMLHKAANSLGVKKKKVGFGTGSSWTWELP